VPEFPVWVLSASATIVEKGVRRESSWWILTNTYG
jgi:hypothetical protein